MKHIILFLLLTVATITAQAQSKVLTVNIKSSIYCDHCKECPSCGKRLENAVYDLKGIKRVDIDEQAKTLVVVYNSEKTNPEEIKKAITQVGFDADDMKADPEAYAQLDDCCKK